MVDENRNSSCTGCAACESSCPFSAIKMIEDEEGFKYPSIDKKKCKNCGICDKCCPINQENRPVNQLQICYAAYSKSEFLCSESSSGGIFSELASVVLNNHGVVFGAAFWNPYIVKHIYIEKKEDLCKLRGSKYFQSDMGDSMKKVKEFLDAGRQVLFSGTPCQVAGVLEYLGKKYENLYLVDIVCHGISSPKMWKCYVCYMERTYNSRVSESVEPKFRYKEKKGSYLKLVFSNGQVYKKKKKKDPFMKMYVANMMLRKSCYSCRFKGIERESDITIGDFWGIEGIDRGMKNQTGVSFVLIHSKKGDWWFNTIKGNIEYNAENVNDAIQFNPSINISSSLPRMRDFFFMNVNDENFVEIEKRISHMNPIKRALLVLYFIVEKHIRRSKVVKK